MMTNVAGRVPTQRSVANVVIMGTVCSGVWFTRAAVGEDCPNDCHLLFVPLVWPLGGLECWNGPGYS